MEEIVNTLYTFFNNLTSEICCFFYQKTNQEIPQKCMIEYTQIKNLTPEDDIEEGIPELNWDSDE